MIPKIGIRMDADFSYFLESTVAYPDRIRYNIEKEKRCGYDFFIW